MDVQKRAVLLKLRGLQIDRIAKLIGKSERTVNRYTQDIRHPKNIGANPLPRNATGLSKEKAEIIGFLTSEGTHYKQFEDRLEFHKKRNKHYRRTRSRDVIEFSNEDSVLINRFQHLMQAVYGYKPKLRERGKIFIRRTKVIRDLLSYTDFGSRKWKVPEELFNSSDDIKSSFLRAHYDGDGSVYVKQVRVYSINERGLSQMRNLMLSLGIETKLYCWKNVNALSLPSRHIPAFQERIGFLHPERKRRLREAAKLIGAGRGNLQSYRTF